MARSRSVASTLITRSRNRDGSDSGGLLADLLEAARRRNLAANSLAAYERTWKAFLPWAAAARLDPRRLPFPTTLEAYRFLGKESGKREGGGQPPLTIEPNSTYKHQVPQPLNKRS